MQKDTESKIITTDGTASTDITVTSSSNASDFIIKIDGVAVASTDNITFTSWPTFDNVEDEIEYSLLELFDKFGLPMNELKNRLIPNNFTSASYQVDKAFTLSDGSTTLIAKDV